MRYNESGKPMGITSGEKQENFRYKKTVVEKRKLVPGLWVKIKNFKALKKILQDTIKDYEKEGEQDEI